MAFHTVQPGFHIALRLPSDTHKVLQITPNTTISLGKFGSFRSNSLLGRPYHLTYEIIEQTQENARSDLRIISAAELHAPLKSSGPSSVDNNGPTKEEEYELVGENGNVVMRTNQDTIDDPSRQTLSMSDIEKLKSDGSISGKDLVAKIISSHTAIDEKSTFSLEKYTLRKAKKFLRRFTVLPVDAYFLAEYVFRERDAHKILELRNETLALIGSWSNVHYGGSNVLHPNPDGTGSIGGGRWLVVDETAGMLVASMAEKMGILHPRSELHNGKEDGADPASEIREPQANVEDPQVEGPVSDETETIPAEIKAEPKEEIITEPEVETKLDHDDVPETNGSVNLKQEDQSKAPYLRQFNRHMTATTNTITVVHNHMQPNLSLLKYFSFNFEQPNPNHPLYEHLKGLSWLQLVNPERDNGYAEPKYIPQEKLLTMKSGKRSNYLRKRRRWNRIRAVVDETRAGGFDGLAVASTMDPVSILKHLVPLLRGGAPVVVYSPTIEPLMDLAEVYSSAKRTAFIMDPPKEMPCEEYPLDPRLLLAPTLQTARVKRWQCLPGRTHPLMTDKGGAEGYLFTGTRVIPAEGKVEAHGNFSKKKKVEKTDEAQENGDSRGKTKKQKKAEKKEAEKKVEAHDDHSTKRNTEEIDDSEKQDEVPENSPKKRKVEQIQNSEGKAIQTGVGGETDDGIKKEEDTDIRATEDEEVKREEDNETREAKELD